MKPLLILSGWMQVTYTLMHDFGSVWNCCFCVHAADVVRYDFLYVRSRKMFTSCIHSIFVTPLHRQCVFMKSSNFGFIVEMSEVGLRARGEMRSQAGRHVSNNCVFLVGPDSNVFSAVVTFGAV